jgi:GDP-4-dehydro-6-deoxy-D-mannose reductase
LRVLITGITGMAGSHLAEYLLSLNSGKSSPSDLIQVFGTYRWRSRFDNLTDLQQAGRVRMLASGGNVVDFATLRAAVDRQATHDKVNMLVADLSDASSMRRLIAAVRPDRVFHLAALSFVPSSWNAPAETIHVNVNGQVNLFEGIREAGIDPLVQIAGSSEEYGLVLPDEVPMKETNPLRPLSPYAVSKIAQEMLGYQYFRSHGLKAVTTRGFNHTGPRRGEIFVTSNFARQIVEIEKGLRPAVLDVGDLTPKRDWSDVRDVVRAYWLALENGEPGQVYNVGSGVATQIGEMLETLRSLTTSRIEVRQDPSRLRPSDVPILWADATKFRRQTGWEPRIPFRQTLADLLEFWRQRV